MHIEFRLAVNKFGHPALNEKNHLKKVRRIEPNMLKKK